MVCILGIGSLGIVSVYEPDTRFVLKGYEVWHNGRCEMRFHAIEDSKATLAVEDTIYQLLGAHPQILKYDGLGCRNVFVFKDWLVKIGGFVGSKIDHQEPPDAEEVRYELPLRGRVWQARDYTKRELFALGCAIYEIMAWKTPFAEMTEDQAEKNYADEVFPDTDGLLVGDVTRACWNEKFETAKDVEKALRKKTRGFSRNSPKVEPAGNITKLVL